MYKCSNFPIFSVAPSGRPLNLDVIRTNTSVTLSWDPPEEKDRNGIITGYDVKYKPTDDSAEEINKEVEATNVVIRNLISGKNYIFMVAAKTSGGIGPYVDNGLERGKFGSINEYSFVNFCVRSK